MVATFGCKSYVKYRYGFTEPCEETPESLASFLEKHKFPLGNMYIFADSSSYYAMLRNRVFRKNLLSHMYFDRKGLLLVRDTGQCQWSGGEALTTLCPDSSFVVWPGLTLSDILPHILPMGASAGADSLKPGPDFTVVVTWAKFIGGYNYRLFNLSDAARANKKSRIRMIWLNLDLQKSWHVTPRQRVTLR